MDLKSTLPTLKQCTMYRGLLSTMGFPGGSAVKNSPAMQEMQKTWLRSLAWEEPLEEGLTTNSSTLAWEILCTEEPGRLQSTGPQRVGHD